MPVLIIFIYAVEEGVLISNQPIYQYYNMLNGDAKERFQNHTRLPVSLLDVTKFACESLVF